MKSLFELEKNDRNKLKCFEKLLKWMNQSPQYNQNRQSQISATRENVLFSRT